MNFRKPALEVLSQWETTRHYAINLLDEVCRRNPLPARDRSALQRLVFAVIRNRRLLELWAARFAHAKLDPKTRRLVAMGTAELVLLDEPAHATVSETVKLAGWAKGLVNGILRNVARESASLRAERETLPPDLRWSVPLFLWERWRQQHGEQAATAFCHWNHLPAPVYVRLNPLKAIPEEVHSSPLLQPLEGHPGFRQIDGSLPLEWMQQGWIYAQDPSTSSAIELLDPQPGQRILDACAAPGGKSFAIAIQTRNEARLTAADQSPSRLRRLEQNLRQLSVEAQVVQADWTSPGAPASGAFDRILLDAPCSNTGVIRRRIDVPHRLNPEDFQGLTRLQEALLGALAPRLAPGGRLVYSTCSIDHEEGHLLVDRFLQGDSRFRKVAEVCTRPWVDQMDGTYAAAIHRVS